MSQTDTDPADDAGILARWIRPLRSDPGATILVVSLFVLVAIPWALAGGFADDEGLLTYQGVQLLREAFWPGLFFQKLHASLSLLYLPFSWLGWNGFIVVHVLVAGAGVGLTGIAVHRMGGRGWVAATVMAISPLFFVSAVSGQSNSTGLAFVALGMILVTLDANWQILTGVVLGIALWTRYEQLPILLGLLGYTTLVQKRWKALAGFAVFPLVYVLAGAIYHGDVLWTFHFPPNLPNPVPQSQSFAVIQLTPRYVAHLLAGLAMVSPVWLLPVALKWRRLPDLGRWLMAIYALCAVLMLVVPLTGTLNFDYNPRYWLVFLPMVAAGAGFLGGGGDRRGWTPVAVVVVVAGSLLAGYAWGEYLFVLGLVPFVAVVLVASFREVARGWAVVCVGLVAAVATCVDLDVLTEYEKPLPRPGVREAAEWIQERKAELGDKTVYTNSHQLAHVLEGLDAGVRVLYLPGYDTTYELFHLLNHDNGQYRRILAAWTPRLYGRAIWSCEMRGRSVRRGDLLVLLPSFRTDFLFPLESWQSKTRELAAFADTTVRTVLRDGVLMEELRHPSWMARRIVEAPCTPP